MIPLGVLAQRQAAEGGVTVQNLGAYGLDYTGGTYTFSGIDIGTEAADRNIFVVVGSRGAAVSTGVTVNGVAATLDGASGSINVANADLWRANVPTGTTVDIVVNQTSSRMNIVVLRVDGTVTPSGTAATANTDAAALPLTISAGGFAIAGSTVYASAATDCQWTDATETATAVSDGIIYTSAAYATTPGSVSIVPDWTVTTSDPYSAARAYTLT